MSGGNREQRFQTRRTFIEGHGHVVEQVPLNVELRTGQAVVPSPPAAPPTRVVITAADVSLELARQVCEAAGMVVVPLNFLNPDQLKDLNLAPTTAAGEDTPIIPAEKPQPAHGKAHKMDIDQMVERIRSAASFDELNALMADETRKTAINAAEERAEQLKAEGAK